MTLTRANIEAIVIRRCGKLLTAAGLDGTTVSGANTDLNDPIGWAVRQCGSTVANLALVADGDLAGVSAETYDQLLDLAELRALQSISQNLSDVNMAAGPLRQDLGQLSDQVDKKIERKVAQIQRDYGLGLGTLEAGVIGLDFMQKNEATT